MQFLMQNNLLISDSVTYLIVKIAVLLIAVLVWMLVIAHPAY